MGVQPKTLKRKPAKARRRDDGKAPGSRLTPVEIEEIFRRFANMSPHPKTELHYVDPFTLLVAVVLSAQATDASVNKATRTCSTRRYAGKLIALEAAHRQDQDHRALSRQGQEPDRAVAEARAGVRRQGA
jgi:hypothetical protein